MKIELKNDGKKVGTAENDGHGDQGNIGQWQHEYKGYVYDPMYDEEPEECAKIFHDVVTPEGKRIHMSWSPYSTPSQADFALWIDLGMPGRYTLPNGSSCNLNREFLKRIQAEKLNAEEDERERYKEFLGDSDWFIGST